MRGDSNSSYGHYHRFMGMKIEGLKAILRGIHVLDGGPASELEYRGSNISMPLWSAQVLEDELEKQCEVHRHVQLPGIAHGRGGCNDRICWHSRPSLRSKKSALSARRSPHGRICTDGQRNAAHWLLRSSRRRLLA